MLRKASILFISFSFLLNCVALYAKGAVSLDSLIQEALKNNPDILAAAKRYEAAKARIPQAKTLDDPVIGLSFQRTKGSPFQLQNTPGDERMLPLPRRFLSLASFL